MRTFEYRLYPNKEQSRLLMGCLAESRHIYNEMLETVKVQYAERGMFPSKYDLTALFKGRGGEYVPATTVQMLADRLSKSLKRFLAARELGIPDVGFPRFKKPNRWHSIQLRQYGTSRDMWVDRDEKHLHVPAKLGKLLKIARQRRDFHYKTAKQYAERYQLIAVEKLTILNMVQNHSLAKSIMDASWGTFLAILEEKAERAGHQVIRVNPRFTSQKCHKCGAIVQKSLSVRTHICRFCGYIADRDVNAAQNILSKAGAQPSDVKHPNGDVRLRSPRL